MKIRSPLFLLFFLSSTVILAQFTGPYTCPSPYVFMDGGGGFIKYYDPAQPLSANNPGNTNIPTCPGGGGLAYMPNINTTTPSPTFYSTAGGTYWYWNGTTWVNTGHSTGNGAAVNIGGCNGAIYNLVGFTGQVYSYNGTGGGTLLTTLQNFNGGGPYDLVTDCNCNFYALNTSAPNQTLTMYSPAGVPLCTYTLNGMPNTTAGGGFAIIGNNIYVKNNLANGFFIGTISGSVVNFTQLTGFTASPGDFACCPTCGGSGTLSNVSITPGGVIGCVNPSVTLVATTTTSPVYYQWYGPGIQGPSTNSAITATAVGVYTCVVSAGGCPPVSATLTSIVVSNAVNMTAVISPSGNICKQAGIPVQLVVAHPHTSDIIAWSGPQIISGIGTSTIMAGAPGQYFVTVTDLYSGCTATDVVTIAQTPTVNIAVSNNTMCAQPINGSPASISFTISGAPAYSSISSPNLALSGGPIYYTAVPTAPFSQVITSANVAVTGYNSFCNHTAYASFAIIPNPNITVTPPTSSICPNGLQILSVIGASTYTWANATGLSSTSGNIVQSTPPSSIVYTVTGTSQGCLSSSKTASIDIYPLPVINLNPLTSTICLGNTVSIAAHGTATSFTWFPSSTLSSPSSSLVVVTPTQTQIYTVIGSLNSCTTVATSTVNTVAPPIVNLLLSTPSVCAYNYNGSPNSIVVTPSGASSYTLLQGSNYSVNSPFGPTMTITPTGTFVSPFTACQTTLIANSSVCTVTLNNSFNVIGNPTINITPPSASICPGSNQHYYANGATSYTWYPDPALTVISPNHVVANPYINSFFSVVGSSQGCNSTVRNAVLVVLPVPTVAIVPAQTTVCAGNSVAIVASGNGTSYTWSPSSFLDVTSGTAVVSTPSTTTNYTVIAFFNTCTNSAVTTISAISIPVLTVTTKDPQVCSGSPAQLNAIGANSFSWSPSSSLNTAVGSAVIAFPISNTTYTARGYNGICTGAGTVTIKTVPRPDLSVESQINSICPGGTLSLKVSGAQSYSWIPSENVYYGNSNSTVIVSPSVTTNYSIIGANYSGSVYCKEQINYSVIVVATVAAIVSPSVDLCLGQKTTLKASGGNAYTWTPSYALNSTDAPAVIASPTVSTVYSVHVSNGGFCGNTATVNVRVNPRPTVFAGRDTTFNLSDEIFIGASGTAKMRWIAGEGIECDSCVYTRVHPTHDGCYVIEASNDFGCSVRDEVCLVITRDYNIYIPNTFTPNKDNLNDVFYVYGENISNVKIEIFTRWGEHIFTSTEQGQGWDGTIGGTDCANGVYVYKITYLALTGKTFQVSGNINLVR